MLTEQLEAGPLQESEPAMKKNLSVVVEDEDLIELMRILIDDDADGAWPFSSSISRARHAICWKAAER